MRYLIGLLAAAAIIVPASAGAQDKGGLAETYKALCSRNGGEVVAVGPEGVGVEVALVPSGVVG